MEDRYLFKAKRLDNGEWVQGCYIYDIDRDCSKSLNEFAHRIQPLYSHAYAEPVDPTTICQCTGLKDKNGKLIWGNDICNYYNSEDKDGIGIIKNDYVLWIDGTISMRHKMTPLFYLQCKNEWKVIGNIFDNKELLESEEK